MSAMLQLSRLFGVKIGAVEDAMRSERGYRAALTRRSLFAAGAALAVGSVMSGGPIPQYVFSDGSDWVIAAHLDEAYGYLEDHSGMTRADYENYNADDLEQLPGWAKIGILCFADGTIAGHDDDYEYTITRTMDDWVRRNGCGFLCTVEH